MVLGIYCAAQNHICLHFDPDLAGAALFRSGGKLGDFRPINLVGVGRDWVLKIHTFLVALDMVSNEIYFSLHYNLDLSFGECYWRWFASTWPYMISSPVMWEAKFVKIVGYIPSAIAGKIDVVFIIWIKLAKPQCMWYICSNN